MGFFGVGLPQGGVGGYSLGPQDYGQASQANTALAQTALGKQQLAQQGQIAQKQIDEQTLATTAAAQQAAAQLGLQRDKFNAVLPLLQGAFGNFTSSLSSGGGGPNNAQSYAQGVANQPTITASGVWSPGQVQGAVNQGLSNLQQGTDTSVRQLQQSLAGRGFGGSSAFAGSQINQARLANNAQAANLKWNIPFSTAQANAQQLLAGQTAQENQFANRRNEANQAQQIANQYRTSIYGTAGSLAAALAGALV